MSEETGAAVDAVRATPAEQAPAQAEPAAPPLVPPDVEAAVRALEARLGTQLPDRGLAMAALTHKSFVNEHRDEGLMDNERLEFLGDAVIDLAVSHRLMERFPGAREGELSKMRAAVVDEQGLSAMARALDLGPLLRLGRGEELTGGRGKASLLADTLEAVVAAVFLRTGLAPVLEIVDRFLGEAFARAAAGTLDRDFKTQLQELAQSRLRATPRYRVVAEHGPDHCKTFEVETDLRGEVLGRASGRSKKDAEQAAAKLALDLMARRLAEGIALVGPLPPAEPEPDAVPTPASPPAVAVAEPEPARALAAPEPSATPEPTAVLLPEEVQPPARPRKRRPAAVRAPRARARAKATRGKATRGKKSTRSTKVRKVAATRAGASPRTRRGR